MNRSRPLTRILPAFCLGCFAGLENNYALSAGVFAFIFLLLLGFLVFHQKGWLPYKYRWIAGVVIQLAVFMITWAVASMQDQRQSAFHYNKSTFNKVLIKLVQRPVRKTASYRSMAEVLLVKEVIDEEIPDKKKWKVAIGKVLVYFPETDSFRLPEEGDVIMVAGKIVSMKPPDYPWEFDFKKYCEAQQIFGSVYTSGTVWQIIYKSSGFNLLRFAHKCRERLIAAYHHAGLKNQELAVVSALVLGDDDGVSNALIQSFSATGTLHVLSVSGMHVGLIYTCIMWLLARIFKKAGGKWFVPLLVLFFIWMYAILTGLSPAVQRAAMMITLLLLGKTYSNSTDTWNLLSGSFMLLVAFDPHLIRDAGFQLSYVSVAGIIGFYPWLYRQYLPANTITNLIWQSTCVALAAQTFTFPFGLYYFHQFPNYFLPANLIIIPLSTVVLFGGIIFLFLLPFSWLAQKAGPLLSYITSILNKSVIIFGDLPHAQLKGIWINEWQLILLFTVVITGVIFLTKKENVWLFAAMILLVIMLTGSIYLHRSQHDQLQIIAWKKKDGGGFTCVTGMSSFTLLPALAPKTSENFKFHYSDAMDFLGIPEHRRIITHRTDTFSSVSPAIWSSPYMILPDTVIKLINNR